MSEREKPTVEVNVDLDGLLVILNNMTEVDVEEIVEVKTNGQNGVNPPPKTNGNGKDKQIVKTPTPLDKPARIRRRRHPNGGGKTRQPGRVKRK